MLIFINLNSIEIAIIGSLILAIIIFSIFKILKQEEGITRFLWIGLVLFAPLIGSIIYLTTIAMEKKKHSIK